jgi:hypothetical protein
MGVLVSNVRAAREQSNVAFEWKPAVKRLGAAQWLVHGSWIV